VRRRADGGGVMSRALRAATALLLAGFSIGLVLALFEVGMRLTGHVAIYEMYSKPSLFWRYDELLGWSHEPGARGEFVGPRPWPIEFRGQVAINSLGLRGPEIPPRDPAEVRVLFSGDSIVAGFEVNNDETFVSLLEGLLRDRLHRPVRTINAGVRGYGTDQDYLYFRERGWRLEPDLVVFFHSGNDPSDNTTIHETRRPFGKPAFSLQPDGQLALVGSPVPHYPSCSEVTVSGGLEPKRIDTALGRALCNVQMILFDHSALFTFLTLAIRNLDGALLSRLYTVGNAHAPRLDRVVHATDGDNPESRLTTAIILAFAHEARSRGAGFAMFGFSGQLAQLDLAAIDRGGIPILDVEQIERRELMWHHDSHLNPQGHREMADLLAPWIEAQLHGRARSVPAAPPAP
jgi:GDSL-like Lipase/Acylhydrolase family